MRKIFIPLLMASAMVPATAMAQDRQWSSDRRSERSEQRSQQREQRSEQRESRRERSAPTVQVERSLPSQASDTARDRSFGQRGDAMRSDRATEVRESRSTDTVRPVTRYAPTPGLDGLVGRRNATEVQRHLETRSTTTTDERRDRDGFGRLGDRVVRDGTTTDHRRDRDHRDGRGVEDRDERNAVNLWTRDGRNDHHRDWRRDWRHDHRYDWRNYRDRNRWVFRIGTYYDPYRYNYRRFDVGYNLWPNYYSSRYWLNDPWQYRLPPAYGPYRWVRYYDDALLVNIYTGQVVDVIYSVFW